MTENLRRFCTAGIKRVVPPVECRSWVDFFNNVGTAARLAALMRSAETLMPDLPGKDEPIGEFAIDPIDCNSAFVGSFYYYAYRVEKREIERTKHRDGTITESIATSYQARFCVRTA